MFHPVGSQSPSVYWRRRALLLGALVVLIVITVWILRPGNGDGSAPSSHGSTSPHTTAGTTPASTPATTPASTPATTSSSSTPRSSSASGKTTGATPAACSAAQLQVLAVAGQATYRAGSQPIVMLQVKNIGTAPCAQDLADSQVELLVYNGESRVWGSHDCEIQPGTDLRTLAVNQPVRVSVTWSGLSSQPNCSGTRQRVGAGTYTLYAKLAGRTGNAAQFSIV